MKLGEKGFTLIELLVSISIMTVLGVSAAGGIYQIFRNIERNGNRLNAILQLHNIGYRLSLDIRQAQNIITDNLTSSDLIALSWVNILNDEYCVTYSYVDIPDSILKILVRNVSINGSANTTFNMAGYINPDPAKTSCNFSDGICNFMITAVAGTGVTMESETRIFKLFPRPG